MIEFMRNWGNFISKSGDI